MKRMNLYLDEKQLELLKTLSTLTLSEHVRRALDQYIDNLQIRHSSASQSKKAGGTDAQ